MASTDTIFFRHSLIFCWRFILSFSQHLMKRIQRGPVRGISLKLQEEERERRMDFIPEVSALNTDTIEVDKDTMDLLRTLNMQNIPGLQAVGENK